MFHFSFSPIDWYDFLQKNERNSYLQSYIKHHLWCAMDSSIDEFSFSATLILQVYSVFLLCEPRLFTHVSFDLPPTALQNDISLSQVCSTFKTTQCSQCNARSLSFFFKGERQYNLNLPPETTKNESIL
jgi:hypothetical protein